MGRSPGESSFLARIFTPGGSASALSSPRRFAQNTLASSRPLAIRHASALALKSGSIRARLEKARATASTSSAAASRGRRKQKAEIKDEEIAGGWIRPWRCAIALNNVAAGRASVFLSRWLWFWLAGKDHLVKLPFTSNPL
jgi:hypothetical protein